VKIVADSYAWIEVFLGSAAGDDARRSMLEAEEVFTPDTVLAEIARKYNREGSPTLPSRSGWGSILKHQRRWGSTGRLRSLQARRT
jgi:predicted nucleic acid-binding protein